MGRTASRRVAEKLRLPEAGELLVPAIPANWPFTRSTSFLYCRTDFAEGDCVTMTNRRRFLTLGALSAMTGGAFTHVGKVNAQGKTEIQVQYDWLMGNGQIGDIVALKKGFFAEQGLAVTFAPGGPNAQTVPPVLAGQSQLGQFSTTSQALVAYGAGRPVRFFACGFQQSPYAYFSLPRSPIRTPRDMIGKTIAVNPNGRFTLQLILALNKIDPSKVRVVTQGVDMAPLIAGQVDAVTGFLTNTKALSVLGPDRIVLTSEQAGFTAYANTYFTSEESYEKHEAILTRFIRAVANGWGWSHANRKAAVEIMCEAYPNLDKEIELATVDIVMGLSFNDATRANGWGWFDNAKIQRQIETFATVPDTFKARVPDLAGVCTHEILEQTASDRPRLA
jgi:NitT/TauT family transport system substrate-binding protein